MTEAPLYVVRVGTDPETAVGQYAEFAGTNLYGPPMGADVAQGVVNAVLSEFLRLSREDAEGFVYGEPVVEVVQVFDLPPDTLHGTTVETLARNWYRPADDRAADARA